MSEELKYTPEDANKDDFKSVHELKEESKEAGEEDKEFELTPEIELEIMDKVRDILQEGTAFSAFSTRGLQEFIKLADKNFHLGWFRKQLTGEVNSRVISDEGEDYDYVKQKFDEKTRDERASDMVNDTQKKLSDALKDGLLAYEPYYGDNEAEKEFYEKLKEQNLDRRSRWAKHTRRWRNSGIYFNIIGESTIPNRNPYEGNLWNVNADLSLIFDLSRHERLDKKGGHFEGTKYKPGQSFVAHGSRNYNPNFGKAFISPMFGFKAFYRVAPRFFQGIVINRQLNEIPKGLEDVYSAELKTIVETETATLEDKKNLLLPIYDSGGNLLWPRKMSYEEVKQFVAERDQGKQLDSGSESGMTSAEGE